MKKFFIFFLVHNFFVIQASENPKTINDFLIYALKEVAAGNNTKEFIFTPKQDHLVITVLGDDFSSIIAKYPYAEWPNLNEIISRYAKPDNKLSLVLTNLLSNPPVRTIVLKQNILEVPAIRNLGFSPQRRQRDEETLISTNHGPKTTSFSDSSNSSDK